MVRIDKYLISIIFITREWTEEFVCDIDLQPKVENDNPMSKFIYMMTGFIIFSIYYIKMVMTGKIVNKPAISPYGQDMIHGQKYLSIYITKENYDEYKDW